MPFIRRIARVALAALAPAAALVCGIALGGCGKKAPEPVVFEAGARVPVSFSLLKADGDAGRTGPISDHYRPTVKFPHEAIEANCDVALADGATSLNPGETANASLACTSQIKVLRDKPGFTVYEGGRKVGQGSVRLP